VIQRICGALLMISVVGCATRPESLHQVPASLPQAPPSEGSSTVAALAAAVEADSRRSDHETDSKIRTELAAQAGRDAQACLARDPEAAACVYGHAVALGLEARAHPTRAGELLNGMLEALSRAESADPTYDEAGPARVRALVLLRAPGWPLGPGDAEAGLVAARRAAALKPLYPPNLLALAEALAKNGDANGARENYGKARDAALSLSGAEDHDEWLREADQGLQRK
jgi:hypothetical protein